MTLRFISDTHAFHHNVIGYDRRPWADTETMNLDLIDNWNRVVKDTDITYHLGDITGGHDPWPFLNALRGQIRIVLGNHDEHLEKLGAEGVAEKSGGRIQLVPPNFKLHGATQSPIILNHYAMESWHHPHKTLHFHGHTHPATYHDGTRKPDDGLRWLPNRYNLCMGVLFWGLPAKAWRPLTAAEVLRRYQDIRAAQTRTVEDLTSNLIQRLLEAHAFATSGEDLHDPNDPE